MSNNNDYYNHLLQYSKKVPCPSEAQIKLDLKRTFPDEKICMQEEFLQKLKNILICYSTRNTSIGYCQGMNFIVGRLLLIMDNEEQTFWLFIQIIEKILPLVYYSELIGIIVETSLMDTLISVYMPKLHKFLLKNNFHVPLRNFIHKWMVCLFTQTMSPQMVYTFLDYFFLDGDITLIKTSLFLISSIHDNLLANNDFQYMYTILNEVPSHMYDTKTMIYFLYEKKFEITESDIKIFQKKMSNTISAKVKEEVLNSEEERLSNRKKSLLKKCIHCNPNWPTCFFEDYDHILFDALIFKESKNPKIIDDYYYIKNEGYQDEIFFGVEVFNKSSENDILIERHKHICDDAKLVDKSKILIDDYKKISEIDSMYSEQNKAEECKNYYEQLGENKDFDNVVKEIKKELLLRVTPINIEEINDILKKNKNDDNKYYPKEYSFYVPE